MRIKRLEKWLIENGEEEMSVNDVKDWINNKPKGNLKVHSIERKSEKVFVVEVWRTIDDYVDTIKAM